MNHSIEKITADILRAFHTPGGAEAAWADDAVILSAPIAGLGLDSLDKLELIMHLEDRFKVLLDEGAVEKCRTVFDLTTLIDKTIAHVGQA